jgi:hypothetical protein
MSKISAEELAKQLNGFDVNDSFTKGVVNLAKNSNLVIVSAIGDDTIIFSGSLKDEFDLLHGGQIFMAKEGGEYIPYKKQSQDKSRKVIEVFWDKHSIFKWKFLTLIKHVTYDLKKDGKSFCKGIIFNLNDV